MTSAKSGLKKQMTDEECAALLDRKHKLQEEVITAIQLLVRHGQSVTYTFRQSDSIHVCDTFVSWYIVDLLQMLGYTVVVNKESDITSMTVNYDNSKVEKNGK